MIKKKKKGGDGGANWMDTYGDMVTLLLCFFVLLYSMSTITEEKFIAIVQSFNPNAVQTQTDPKGNDGPVADPPVESEADAIEQLFKDLQAYVDQQGQEQSISVTQGDGYVFLSMDNTIFFNGDSYVLREDGKRILDDLSNILAGVSADTDEIRILGHTAQASPARPNAATGDRFLASNRATVVTVYLQEKNFIDPARLVSIGYGQHRPVSPNDTSQERAKNRRVEFIISGKVEGKLDSVEEYHSLGKTVPPKQALADPATPTPDTTTAAP